MASSITSHHTELLNYSPSNTGFTDGQKAQQMTTDRFIKQLGCRTEPPLTGRVKSILKPTHLQQPRTVIPKQVSWATSLQQPQPQPKALPGLIWPDRLEKHHAAPQGMIWPDKLEKHHAVPQGMTWPDRLEKDHAPSEPRSGKRWSDVKPTTPNQIVQTLAQQAGLSTTRMTWSAVRPVSGNAINRALGLTSQYFAPPTDGKTRALPTSPPRKKWSACAPLSSPELRRTLNWAGLASSTEINSLLKNLMHVANDIAPPHGHRGITRQQALIEEQLRVELKGLTFVQQQRLLSKLEGNLGDGIRAIGRVAQHQLTLSDTDIETQETRGFSRLAESTRLVDGLTRALRRELHITSARFTAVNAGVNNLSQLLPNERKAMQRWLANQ